MTLKRRQRLILVCLLVASVAIAVKLILTALNQNINLFFSPSQIVAGKVPKNTIFRIGGVVVYGSVERSETDLSVKFKLTDTVKTIPVVYTGILPDLFREGQGIVAIGAIQQGIFLAEQVLAKHDETYMPSEVSESLKAANSSEYGDQN